MVDTKPKRIAPEQPQPGVPDLKSFCSFQNNKDGFKSKVHINRFFYNSHKVNSKNRHFHRRGRSSSLTRHAEKMEEELPPQKTMLPPSAPADEIYQTSIPNCVTYAYEGVGSRIFNTRFTPDGKKLVVATHTGASVFNFGDDCRLTLDKTARCNNLNIAITDLDVSDDNRYAVHSNLSPFVHMLDLEKGTYTNEFIFKNGNVDVDMADELFWFFSLRIYSLKISSDAKQMIAGCGKALNGAPVQVFDVEAQKLKSTLIAHKEDINGITYLDKKDPSVFITASDDGVCKLWDTRALKNFTPSGIFYGHVSGLTSVESKNDGRHFISNCKDQSIKLWDVRTFTTEKKDYPFLKYDYRYETLSPQHIEQIKLYQKRFDMSVMSFWGHQVHLTLIRSHFSPLYGTNQRYIYTGSYDGTVYVYDTLDAKNVSRLEAVYDEHFDPKKQIVRDCTWHPNSQNLVSANFHGDVFKWEYTDLRDAEVIRPEIECSKDGIEDEDYEAAFLRKKFHK